MQTLTIRIADPAMAALERLSAMRGVPVETIAAQMVESKVIEYLPGGLPNMHFGQRVDRLDLGSCDIGLRHNTDGSISITA